MVYPCKIHHNGRSGGLSTLYAETAQARLEWKAKLEEAIGLRKVIQESNKVFEVETLSTDTFFTPTLMANAGPSWNNDENFTGKVTCSAAFSKQPSIPTRVSVLISWVTATPDGRGLVAIGCAEGVWVGSRQDSRCTSSPPPWSAPFLTLGVRLAMERVLHLRMVSQFAMLEDFGIFLVLADKVGGVRPRVFLVADGLCSRSLPTISGRSFHRHPE